MQCSSAVFLILTSAVPQGSANGCQGFSGMKMRIGGRVLLAFLSYMYELKCAWRHSTITMPSLTASRKSITASGQKLPYSIVKSFSTARHRQSTCQANRLGYRSV
jgi:hypothetical protein